MNVGPSAPSADMGTAASVAVALDVAALGQVQPQPQPQGAEPNMQMLMAQLAQVLDVDVSPNAVHVDNAPPEPVALNLEPMLLDEQAAFAPHLPAMQLPWSWPQASVQLQAAQQAVVKEVAQPAPAAMTAIGSLMIAGPSLSVVEHAMPSVALSSALPVAKAIDDGASVTSALLEPALSALQLQGRVTPDALRTTPTEPVALTPGAAVSVNKGPQALVQALADRVQVQQVQGAQIATVRLDPPQMGSLEIRIRQDAAGVHVQMQASHGEVGRQLANVADSLRQELLARSPDAQVTVSHSRSMASGGQSDPNRHGQRWNDEPEIGQALKDSEHSALT